MTALRTMLLVGICAWCTAIQPVAQQVAPPSDLSVGYGELLRELRSLRPVSADTTGSNLPDPGMDHLMLDGLVVDETITPIGRDFYEVFFSAWDPPAGAANFTITVDEQPMPGIGTLVVVRVNGEPVYQGRVQPGREQIEAAAFQAVGFVARYFQNRTMGPAAY